jgi:hypothetical protein
MYNFDNSQKLNYRILRRQLIRHFDKHKLLTKDTYYL